MAVTRPAYQWALEAFKRARSALPTLLSQSEVAWQRSLLSAPPLTWVMSTCSDKGSMENSARANLWPRPDLQAVMLSLVLLTQTFKKMSGLAIPTPVQNSQSLSAQCLQRMELRWETMFMLPGVARALDRGHSAF